MPAPNFQLRKKIKAQLTWAACSFCLLCAPSRAAFTDLVSLGSGAYTIEPSVSLGNYAQDAEGTRFSPSVVLGDTVGGTFVSGPFNWSVFSDLNSTIYLGMSFTGANPLLPIQLELFNADLSMSIVYAGSTDPLLGGSNYYRLDLVTFSSDVLTNVGGAQITWDGGATMNANVETIATAIGGSFTARAPGGVRFITSSAAENDLTTNNTNPPLGVYLTANATSWSTLSDRNAKTAVTPVDHRETLRNVAALPVTTWQYRHDPQRRYVGPMAQDFHATFGLGHDDKHISTLDTDGVTLSALKGLIAELEVRKQRSAAQAKRLQELQAELEKLQQALANLSPPPGE